MVKKRQLINESLAQLSCVLGLLGPEAKLYFFAYVMVGLASLYLESKSFFVYGTLMEGLENRDVKMFEEALTETIALTILVPAMRAVLNLVKDQVVVSLTGKLINELLRKYLEEKIYYETRFLSNEMDARAFKENTIQKTLLQDVKHLFVTLTDFFVRVIAPFIKLGALSAILYQVLSVRFVSLIVGFTILFSVAETYLKLLYDGKTNEVGKMESNIHNRVAWVATNAEEVGFWKSERVELKHMKQVFSDFFSEQLNKSGIFLAYMFIYRLEGDFYSIAVYLLFYQEYFYGSMSLADMQRVHYALREVLYAAWMFRTNGSAIYTTLIHRVPSIYFLAKPRDVFHEYVKTIRSESKAERASQTVLSVRNLTLQTYQCDGYMIKDLNLVLRKGDRMLVSGKNGAGKTSLFRCFANLLPVRLLSHDAVIECLPSHEVMFLSQKAFLVPGLSLKDQLLYPTWVRKEYNTEADDEKKEASKEDVVYLASNQNCTSTIPTNDEIEEVLEIIGLAKRLRTTTDTKPLSITAPREDWNVLSGGEKEMLSFGRLLLAKPRLVFLDEATAGLAEHIESKLYDILYKDTDITYISIGHRKSLERFHNRRITFQKDGAYEISDM